MTISVEAAQADWVYNNFITSDTQSLAAEADERAINASVRYAKGATRFDHIKLPEDMERKMRLLKLGLTLRPHPTRRRAPRSRASRPAWKGRTARVNTAPATEKVHGHR